MSPKLSEIERKDPDKSSMGNLEAISNDPMPNPRKDAPSYVANLSPDERIKAEKALVRKIDLRLLPMIILMYILNYLDRNNIVGFCG